MKIGEEEISIHEKSWQRATRLKEVNAFITVNRRLMDKELAELQQQNQLMKTILSNRKLASIAKLAACLAAMLLVGCSSNRIVAFEDCPVTPHKAYQWRSDLNRPWCGASPITGRY